MYNRYIPQNTSYTWVGQSRNQADMSGSDDGGKIGVGSRIMGLLGSLRGMPAAPSEQKERGGLLGILKGFNLEKLDSGDILLLLIAILLLVEGEDIDLAIALGLVFLLGYGEQEREEQ